MVALIGCGGISKAVCGATFPAVNELVGLEYVEPTNTGKVNKAIATQFPFGLCLEAGGAVNDLCTVLLTPIHKAIVEDLP